VFSVGAILYTAIELIYRGHTHWTMSLTGGVCLCLICFITTECPDVNCFFRWIVCAVGICAVEFLVGYIVNILFGFGVWDYSHRRFNIAGQICLHFGVMWFLLSIPGDFICRYICRTLAERSKTGTGRELR